MKGYKRKEWKKKRKPFERSLGDAEVTNEAGESLGVLVGCPHLPSI